jgi:hypothetical protein
MEYVNNNNLLFNGHIGFRHNHSCESALHELLSKINTNLSKKLITILLLIDFRKAFDLVCYIIILFKLKVGYHFDDKAINLLENYFNNRKIKVKVNLSKSQLYDLLLGAPQGSVLGPLLFMLFINDLPLWLTEFLSILFADDTSLEMCDINYELLLAKFEKAIPKMNTWCKYNLIDINWEKTKVMFFSKCRNFKPPKFIKIHNVDVQVVDDCELLGIIIDNKLNFDKHTCALKKTVCTRLYSIKQLFYLSHRVRIQFLKTFILPHFDYGATLSIYYSKNAIQRLGNLYNRCIVKLIDSKAIKSHAIDDKNDLNTYNNYLLNFGLQTYQHRIILRFATYIYKIMSLPSSPRNLSSLLALNSTRETIYQLRNANLYTVPGKNGYNDCVENTFQYFFAKFLNEFSLIRNGIVDGESVVKIKWNIKENLNDMFVTFIELFTKFDIKIRDFRWQLNTDTSYKF